MSNSKKKFDVYLGKYRSNFGYGKFYVGGADDFDEVKGALKKAQCKTGDDVFIVPSGKTCGYDGYGDFGIVKVEHSGYPTDGSYKDIYVNANNLKYGRGCFSEASVKKLLR
jgi:hypothetical protein